MALIQNSIPYVSRDLNTLLNLSRAGLISAPVDTIICPNSITQAQVEQIVQFQPATLQIAIEGYAFNIDFSKLTSVKHLKLTREHHLRVIIGIKPPPNII